jgi:hypothetical protein
VVIDETQYEGNIPESWGSLTPQMMVSRFWEGTVRGGYVGHGETYLDAADELWWSKGGVLRGSSAPRLHFLAQVLARGPQCGYDPVAGGLRSGFAAAGKGQEVYLIYCSHQQPGLLQGVLPGEASYAVEVLDTWNMTSDARPDALQGQFRILLPARPWMAVLFTRVEGS